MNHGQNGKTKKSRVGRLDCQELPSVFCLHVGLFGLCFWYTNDRDVVGIFVFRAGGLYSSTPLSICAPICNCHLRPCLFASLSVIVCRCLSVVMAVTAKTNSHLIPVPLDHFFDRNQEDVVRMKSTTTLRSSHSIPALKSTAYQMRALSDSFGAI